MTLHAAKDSKFPRVFLSPWRRFVAAFTAMAYKNDQQLEEERRVIVGITPRNIMCSSVRGKRLQHEQDFRVVDPSMFLQQIAVADMTYSSRRRSFYSFDDVSTKSYPRLVGPCPRPHEEIAEQCIHTADAETRHRTEIDATAMRAPPASTCRSVNTTYTEKVWHIPRVLHGNP